MYSQYKFNKIVGFSKHKHISWNYSCIKLVNTVFNQMHASSTSLHKGVVADRVVEMSVKVVNNYFNETKEKYEKSAASKFLNILVKICLLPISVEGDVIKFKIWKATIHLLTYGGIYYTSGIVLMIYSKRDIRKTLIAPDSIVELVALCLSCTQYLSIFLLLGLSFKEMIL